MLHIVYCGKLNSAPAQILNPLPTPCIAVIDDNASVLRALDRMIRSLGMNAKIYSSAAEFLATITSQNPPDVDCLILDIQMPCMNGLELQLRLFEENFSSPIIMISAHDDIRAQQQALAGGAIAFLKKPFRDDLLISTLNEALEVRP